MRRDTEFRPEPLAYFLTWTTYASWMPGDGRGWADKHGGLQAAAPRLQAWAFAQSKGQPFRLNLNQRRLVEMVIADHGRRRSWLLHAVTCREQHVHVVVTAHGYTSAEVSRQLKAWTSRRLRDCMGTDRPIWTRRCSGRWIFDERGLAAVVEYVNECQDRARV